MRLRLLITGCAVTTMFAVGGNAQEEQTGPGALRVTSVTLTIEGTSYCGRTARSRLPVSIETSPSP